MSLFAEGEDIKDWWNRVKVGKHILGTGRSSEAFLVKDKDKLYFVRVTDVTNIMTKRNIRHEIKIYQHLLAHPNYAIYISPLLYAYCPPDRSVDHEAFFIFQHSLGMPMDVLVDFFKRNHTFIKKSTIDMWHEQMKETIEFMKTVGIVHRDIKPSNVFLNSETNRLLLFDFDTACFAGEDCKTTDFRGTQIYAKKNAVQMLHSMFHPPYQYTHDDDLHAIEVMFARDISSITETL